MRKTIKRLGTMLLDTVYPRACPVCRDVVTPKGELICPGCREKLPYVTEPVCMRCGSPIASEQEEYCHNCEQRELSYERGIAVFVYDDMMQQAVADFKYRNRRELADFFAEEMLRVFQRKFSSCGVETFVPVPVHDARKRYRGYNQAEELCRVLAERTGIPVADVLVRDKKTAPQKELDARERLRNLESAIRYKEEALSGKHVPNCVVLVDDIYTTGSTAEACTRALLRGGVNKVYLFSLCIGTER